ncbi:CapA family protein [Cohaesibacter sp. ES.047]|uniref:CapA family protein n=1 Tax=Cohaesibacter sp. ES.047 TaxID=1798205 RepID=UPI0012FD0FC3|nr:CapA family protein [Cohaesibacter sp. ES.047]
MATMTSSTLASLETDVPADSYRAHQTAPPATHLVLVMVGDTGFAPSRAKPHPIRVVKYGTVLTFAETLKYIRDDIDGDINFANMESVVSASASLRPRPKKYNFVTHPNGAKALVDAGFNLFSLANNHAYDYGNQGVIDTLQNVEPLKAHGLLAYAGVGKTRLQAAHTPVFMVKSMKVAFGSIGIGGGGAGRAAANKVGQLSLFHQPDKTLLANNLRLAPADLRLLSVHHGPERHIRPSGHEVGFQRKLVMDANANVMLGHHAHVARGIEMIDGRLIVYGLGNFNHQGTANMNGKSGCHDYSLMVKVHLVHETGHAPAIAAVEALPINWTHMQPRRVTGKQGARRIAILNGLSAQFDDARVGSKGVRFMAQTDGSGIYCTKAATGHPATRQLCSNFSPMHLASAGVYRRAVATCGRSAPTTMIANALGRDTNKGTRLASLNAPRAITALPFEHIENQVPTLKPGLSMLGVSSVFSLSFPPEKEGKKPIKSAHAMARDIPDTYRLAQNPRHWPKGMPLAWAAPEDESQAAKAKRWRARHYTVAEVETLLRKRGLIE